jgi:hypothetical protein
VLDARVLHNDSIVRVGHGGVRRRGRSLSKLIKFDIGFGFEELAGRRRVRLVLGMPRQAREIIPALFTTVRHALCQILRPRPRSQIRTALRIVMAVLLAVSLPSHVLRILQPATQRRRRGATSG